MVVATQSRPQPDRRIFAAGGGGVYRRVAVRRFPAEPPSLCFRPITGLAGAERSSAVGLYRSPIHHLFIIIIVIIIRAESQAQHKAAGVIVRIEIKIEIDVDAWEVVKAMASALGKGAAARKCGRGECQNGDRRGEDGLPGHIHLRSVAGERSSPPMTATLEARLLTGCDGGHKNARFAAFGGRLLLVGGRVFEAIHGGRVGPVRG
jgi:hypothetical protein